jgi:hypothetical protein
MSDTRTIESRVAALEQEVAELKRAMHDSPQTDNWFDQLSGRFKDDPDFAEIVRLGREYRQSCFDETEA